MLYRPTVCLSHASHNWLPSTPNPLPCVFLSREWNAFLQPQRVLPASCPLCPVSQPSRGRLRWIVSLPGAPGRSDPLAAGPAAASLRSNQLRPSQPQPARGQRLACERNTERSSSAEPRQTIQGEPAQCKPHPTVS